MASGESDLETEPDPFVVSDDLRGAAEREGNQESGEDRDQRAPESPY